MIAIEHNKLLDPASDGVPPHAQGHNEDPAVQTGSHGRVGHHGTVSPEASPTKDQGASNVKIAGLSEAEYRFTNDQAASSAMAQQKSSPLFMEQATNRHDLSPAPLSATTGGFLEAKAAARSRPGMNGRALSIPVPLRSPAPPLNQKDTRDIGGSPSAGLNASGHDPALLSPLPSAMPLSSLSIPTYLQLELSSHRSSTGESPYEPSRVKLERLLNFFLLPLHLESVLLFGTLVCLDAWLHTFTILPLRLAKSCYLLARSWSTNVRNEVDFLFHSVYDGVGRMWRRQWTGQNTESRRRTTPTSRHVSQGHEKHRGHNQGLGAPPQPTSRLMPSTLLPDDKADILKGLLIIGTCLVLLKLDASRMYHWIRGQAAIKLYVIYNVLEVCDRLFSAIGQDILECLFSRETLERKANGRSKIIRPFWLFLLAWMYTVIHSTALFYQVVTLNVAVNSYSNALITLLLSNQFVEIKSTVFKRIEKENLFQLTAADVVERFQLWLMMTIIASRNIVETGGMSVGLQAVTAAPAPSTTVPAVATNVSEAFDALAGRPTTILPSSFTLVPALLASMTLYVPAIVHVLGPFVVVLGSEMLVDWLKHAYVNKFNNTRPTIYDRFLDVLAKDYHASAFDDQNLVRRLGLPVIPLSCLFIRASVQTYHMFMTAWVPGPSASPSASLASIHEQYTASAAFQPTSTAAILSQSLDRLLRHMPAAVDSTRLLTMFTTVLVITLVFLLLLALKLVLGITLLAFTRSRCGSMQDREKRPTYHLDAAKRYGGWGMVEVDDDKRRRIYDDDPAGLRALREREQKGQARREKALGENLDHIQRYELGTAKRIW